MAVALETAPGVVAVPLTSTSHPVTASPLDIASDHCKACELCIGVCSPGVLALDLTVVNLLGYHPIQLTNAAGCTSCALCARVCPDAVFTVYAPRKEA